MPYSGGMDFVKSCAVAIYKDRPLKENRITFVEGYFAKIIVRLGVGFHFKSDETLVVY
jgi:hypothetical protein